MAPSLSRRDFLRRSLLSPATVACLSRSAGASQSPRRLRFGLISDIHQDVMPDGIQRVKAFVAAMEAEGADFILQLGDFCQPHPRNKPFLAAWNAFRGPRYHVLGNHDMDSGYQREQTAAFFGMPATHYAFTAGPVRCVVLDGNEPGGKAKGYKRFIAKPQLAWFEGELARADRPILIFIHQPLDADDGIENAAVVRAAIERTEAARPGRVAAVFAGHLHADYERLVHGVRYLEINSASYWWLSNPAAYRETYPPAVHKAHPYLNHVAAYREALWAVVTLDFDRGEMVVEGRRSAWVGPDPWQRGDKTPLPHEQIHPAISDLRVKVAASY
jgi:3',5'-cyclic-AMP phosphodiesterase